MKRIDRDTPGLIGAVHAISRALTRRGIPHVFIGGIAQAVWARPRTTADIDLLIMRPGAEPKPVVEALSGEGFELASDIHREPMVSGFRMVRRDCADAVDVPVDALVSDNPLVCEIMERARARPFAGRRIMVPSAEDHVLLKLQAGRIQDLADAQAVLRARGARLDVAFLEDQALVFDVRERLEMIRRAGR